MESIIEKIQKLLALSGSPNEHEAKLALGKARELMERHNISMATVESTEIDSTDWITETVHTCGRTPPYEIESVMQALEKIFFVRSLCFKTSDMRTRHYRIFGAADNIAVAKHAFVYFSRTFRTLWAMYRYEHDAPTSAARVYYFGLQAGLVSKVLAERKVDQVQDNALVVIESKIDEAMMREFPHVRRKAIRLRPDEHAYSRGLDDGRGIELHQPIDRTESRQEITRNN